eukprot:gene8068-17517_t
MGPERVTISEASESTKSNVLTEDGNHSPDSLQKDYRKPPSNAFPLVILILCNQA